MLEGYGLIAILLIGLIAGWLAGKIMRGSGFGIIGDIIIGIIGAFIGNWLWIKFHLPGIGTPLLTAIIVSTVGACILVFVIGLFRR